MRAVGIINLSSRLIIKVVVKHRAISVLNSRVNVVVEDIRVPQVLYILFPVLRCNLMRLKQLVRMSNTPLAVERMELT